MSTHSYSLRSRISNSSLSGKTSAPSPLIKTTKPPRKTSSATCTLQLKHVVGTTTSNPGGLSCCAVSDAYAYCAGSVAVLAKISSDNEITYRYFKARPTVLPINQNPSYYESPSTQTRRRSTLYPRKGVEDYRSSPLGKDWLEETSGQTWSARERIKAATCVSISPDGRVLAVGETGYNPRVLLFSIVANAPTDTPLSIITDHTIGVRNVAFSPNSKYLATLGDVNDGFLYIWQINTKTGALRLHSSNRCTTNICDMTWCGANVVTVGTRHIKIWQALGTRDSWSQRRVAAKPDASVQSPGPIPLQGRNCLLGTFADLTFTAVGAISESRAVVCTDDGHLCLLDLSSGKIGLSVIQKTDTTIAAITYKQDPLTIVWISADGLIEEREMASVHPDSTIFQPSSSESDARKRRRRSRQSLLRQSLGLSSPKLANTVALGCFNNKVVCIDADGMIKVSRTDVCNAEADICRISSHKGLVEGIQRLHEGACLGSFYTWARSGEIRFWDNTGNLVRTEMVDLDQSMDPEDAMTNELKVVSYSTKTQLLLTGDQYGIVTVIDRSSWSCVHTVRAHSAEISDIAIHEGGCLVATCSRDRMVQVFLLRSSKIELIQTSDDHISAVSQVLFNETGTRLLSCSADRTVVIRDRIQRKVNNEAVSAFIPTKTITLKASPLSMRFLPFKQDILVVSTMDRYVLKIDLVTGSTLASFKVSDRESDDTVMLNSTYLGGCNATNDGVLLAGFSAIDKSIRLYDLDKGILLGRDSGHTEGISDLIMIDDEPNDRDPTQTTIVSAGLDSTIMIWTATATGRPLTTPQQELSQDQAFGSEPEKNSIVAGTLSLPPIRKILSKIDVAEFSRQSSPTRDVSPGGLRRRPSRLALATSIDEADEAMVSQTCRARSEGTEQSSTERSPSPPAQLVKKLQKQRSRSEMNNGKGFKSCDQKESSPAIPPLPPLSGQAAPATALRNSTKANNSRLRRPPSIPTSLRAQAVAQERRQSISGVSDLSPIDMAANQLILTLKNFDKKIQASRLSLDLDGIEEELEALLKTIRSKKIRTINFKENNRPNMVLGNITSDIDKLNTLMENTDLS